MERMGTDESNYIRFISVASVSSVVKKCQQFWQHVLRLADNARIGITEDGRSFVGVDRDEGFRAFDSGAVQGVAPNSGGDVNVRRDLRADHADDLIFADPTGVKRRAVSREVGAD